MKQKQTALLIAILIIIFILLLNIFYTITMLYDYFA